MQEVAMRRVDSYFGLSGSQAFGLLGFALALAAVPAFGQSVPEPRVPDIMQRSGLLMRFTPIEPRLPPDPRRDTFYDTRWDDNSKIYRINGIKGGGLYGLPWKADCTKSVYPYFYGSPGQDTLTCNCKPWWPPLRIVQGLVQPFRPVGMYYDQGSYVPIYDLDPIVPGPGVVTWPWFLGGPPGG
jgi:hypothetical protein